MAFVRQDQITARTKERHYIDVTSRILSAESGVTGNNYNFTAQIQPFNLDANKHYTVSLVSIRYPNQNLAGPGPVYPVLLSNLGENIRVNNINASVLWQSNVNADNPNFVYLDYTNSPIFYVPLRNKNFNQVVVELQRSDNGQPFVIPDGPQNAVSVTILIESD